MEVTMGLELQSILELDMVKGTLTSLAWFNFAWNDPFLKWDKEHFSREHLSSASKFGPYQKVHMYFRLLSSSMSSSSPKQNSQEWNWSLQQFFLSANSIIWRSQQCQIQ